MPWKRFYLHQLPVSMFMYTCTYVTRTHARIHTHAYMRWSTLASSTTGTVRLKHNWTFIPYPIYPWFENVSQAKDNRTICVKQKRRLISGGPDTRRGGAKVSCVLYINSKLTGRGWRNGCLVFTRSRSTQDGWTSACLGACVHSRVCVCVCFP